MGDTEGKRERKKTTFFKVVEEVTSKKEVSITEGTGVKLADHAFFVKELDKRKGDDELVKYIHSLLFGSFSGFPLGTKKEEKIAKIEEKKKAWTTANLKIFLGMLGLEKGGDRNALISRVVDYLFEPSITKSLKSSGKKRSKSSSSEKKTKKASKKSKKDVEVDIEDGAEEDDFKDDEDENDKEEEEEVQQEEEDVEEKEGDDE